MVDFNAGPLNAAITSGTSPSDRVVPIREITDAVLAGLSGSGLVTVQPPSRLIPRRPPTSGKIRITFEVYEEHAPALRSAVEEISNDIGGRLTGSHRFSKEQALTDAAIALAALRVAVFAKIADGDPNYV